MKEATLATPARFRPGAIAARCAEALLAGGLAAAVSAATFALMSWAETPGPGRARAQAAQFSRVSWPPNDSPRPLTHALAAPADRHPRRACPAHAALTAALAPVLRSQTGNLARGVTDPSSGVTASCPPA